MHHMPISTTFVFTVMLMLKNLKIRNFMTVNTKTQICTKTECREMEPNSVRDRAMYDGDNPSI
jgi:hypothetical protein